MYFPPQLFLPSSQFPPFITLYKPFTLHFSRVFRRVSVSVMATKSEVVFEDFFPSMVEKLGADGFVNELCNGFRLLMDSEKRVITFESLKKNSAVLGLQEMNDSDLTCMLNEGDLDGDGCLNQMEFCVLMFRLSPDLMKRSRMFSEVLL